MDRPPLTDATVLRRKPHLSDVEKDGQFVMLDVESGAYFAMDAVGCAVWNALAQPVAFANLVDLIVLGFDGAGRAEIEADLQEFIPQLFESDLIEVVTGP